MGGLSGLGSASMIFRKSIVLVSLLAAGCPITWAQSPAPAAQPETAPTPAQPQAAQILQRIVLVEQGEAGDRFQPPETGDFVVASPGLPRINVADLNVRLAVGKGQPITDQLLVAINQVIETAIRPEFPFAAAAVLPQKLQNGAVRVTIALLRIRDVKFVGNRWYSNSLLQDRLRVNRGEIVQLSNLDEALKWTNNSPYRRVQVHIDQIPNTNEANLIANVQDKLPLRLVLSGDTGGNDIIGRHRMSATASYGNVFGREHEASYSFITTEKSDIYKAHAVSYRIPFENFKSLQFSASHSNATPSFLGAFNQEAKNTTADIRFSMPVRTGDKPVEAFAAVAFKRSNSDLEFFGTNVSATASDIFQATLGASAIWRDKQGAWAAALSATGSPGNVNSHNTDRVFGGEFDANGNITFEGVRFGAEAQYAYASLSIQRYQILPFGMELSARATFQVANTNLLPSEQISIGGATTVRGYRESIIGGDKGYAINTEILSPTMRFPLPKALKRFSFVETRVLTFFDVGDVGPIYKFNTDRRLPPLASVGFGVRAALPGHMSLTADYGFQLTELPGDEKGRGHLKLVIAF